MKYLALNGLLVQTVLLMTLALFPLGAVAIFQTNRVAVEAERDAELALLAVTGRAAKAEELIIERAFGVAQFVGSIAGDFLAQPETCAARLGPFVQNDDAYSFIGILPQSGLMTCASTGQTYDFSEWDDLDRRMAAQERSITVNLDAPASGQSVFIVSEPFTIDGAFAGFISVSVPHNGLPVSTEELTELGLEELITFSPEGDILTARTDISTAAGELPSTRPLTGFSATTSTAFRATNRDGIRRTYTVVPIEGSPASVMGIWRANDGLAGRVANFIQPALFPVLMWVASMSVAMLSIYTLVMRHISRLRKDMDAFAENRTVPAEVNATAMPNEFLSLNTNFSNMAQDIMQDEARLEDTLREKNVLIKEVHHRVKNNLQLISSIMNMQIREAQHDETKSVLSRLQDRIISLATIHKDLYQSQNGGMVDAGALVADIVEKTLEMAVSDRDAITVETSIDPVLLFPDQAVPLSLLAAEGMTNAMKYLSVSSAEKPWLHASLRQTGTSCTLTLANAIGGTTSAESTGLGAHLINAFGIQLGGKIDTEQTADSYTMTVRFDIAEFVPDAADY
ncbi:sensor histidine kinase [Yoonia sp. SS1-5]|uniref:histidine kinase n=1 Tax=Yoonia rhodophyticola TaxID=3137370 RepID=A0AAN0M9V9_9RHOB